MCGVAIKPASVIAQLQEGGLLAMELESFQAERRAVWPGFRVSGEVLVGSGLPTLS